MRGLFEQLRAIPSSFPSQRQASSAGLRTSTDNRGHDPRPGGFDGIFLPIHWRFHWWGFSLVPNQNTWRPEDLSRLSAGYDGDHLFVVSNKAPGKMVTRPSPDYLIDRMTSGQRPISQRT